jgi:tRNA dimethylallyltransferase
MNQTEKQKNINTLVVLLGPTGVGKTTISLRLAELLKCPIVSSDSRQFYKELKIGTAAPTEEELKRVQHYFIGSHSIFDIYNCGQYEQDALQLLDTIFIESPVALLVGGSMMYIDALCKGMDDIPTIDAFTREYWQKTYAQIGLHGILEQLMKLDPIHYEQVDKKNPKRILHALEIISIAGKAYSDLRKGQIKNRNFSILKIGLNRPRSILYDRINARVDTMIQQGLVEEAAKFYEYRHLNTLNTVGYKELYAYMNGEYNLEHAIHLIKQDSRRYAKRQLTWFNKDTTIKWFEPEQENEIIQLVTAHVSTHK